MPESKKVKRTEPRNVEISISVTGEQECIAKLESVRIAAEELQKAIKNLNNLSITIITTNEQP